MKKMAAMIDHAWLKSPLRDQLAQEVFDEIVEVGHANDLKDYVWEELGEWAKLFLQTSQHFHYSENNIRLIQKYLLPDIVARANEIIKKKKEEEGQA